MGSTCNEAILKQSFALTKSNDKQLTTNHKRNKTEPELDTIQLPEDNKKGDVDIFQSFLHSITILDEIQKYLEISAFNNSATIAHLPLRKVSTDKTIPITKQSKKTNLKGSFMSTSIPSSTWTSSNTNRMKLNQISLYKKPKENLSDSYKQKMMTDQVIASNKRKQNYLEVFDKINESIGNIRQCILIKEEKNKVEIIKEEIGNWDFSESGFTESLLKHCNKDLTITYCDDLLDEETRINCPQLLVTQSNNIKEHHKQFTIQTLPSKIKESIINKNVTTLHSNVSTSANKNDKSMTMDNKESKENNKCLIY